MDSVVLVARKYIERNSIAEDGPKRTDELGLKTDIEDSTDVHDRNITFARYQRPLTTTEATQAVAKELTGTVQDTGQYLHEVKNHMDKQMSAINKIKAQKKEFDRELEMLQFGNQQHEADPSIVEISKIREELVEKKRLEETNLARLSNHMTVTKKQVEQYQSLIDEVDDKLRRVQPQTQKLTDADKQIISKILSSTIGRTQNVEVAKTLNQLAASLEQSG